MPTPASILKNTVGYDTFRPLQNEVIENVLRVAAGRSDFLNLVDVERGY